MSRKRVRIERVDNCGTLLDEHDAPRKRQTTWAVYVDGQWTHDVDTRSAARKLARAERAAPTQSPEVCAEEVRRHGFCRHCESR